MVINFSNIGTSGGGEYTLPTATDSRLGGVKIGSGITVTADGTISAEGGDVLNPIEEVPAEANEGEVRAFNIEGEHFLRIARESVPEDNYYGQVLYFGFKGTFQYTDEYDGEYTYGYFDFPSDVWHSESEIGTDWTLIEGIYLKKDDDYFYFTADESEGIFEWRQGAVDGREDLNTTMKGVYQYINGEWLKVGDFELPIASTDTLGAIKVGDNLYMDGDRLCANGGGGISDRLNPVEELPEDASEGDMVSYLNHMWVYKENPKWGEWKGCFSGQGLKSSEGAETYLYYDYLPYSLHGTKMCEYRYYGSYYDTTLYLFFDMDNDCIKVCTSDDFDTEAFDNVFIEDQKIWSFGIGSGYFEWQDGYFRFWSSTYNNTVNRCGTQLSDYGWEKIDNSRKAIVGGNDNFNIVQVNANGEVTRHQQVETAAIYFNTTGYSSSNFFVSSTNNIPSRMWVPTQGGSTGQVLTSTGGNEPQWATLIKSVRITEEEYEALETKDPNTLYLIVEE